MWFGRPGQLVELPSPMRGITGTPSVETSVITLLSGAKVVQRASRSSRSWTLPYRFLTNAEAGLILGYHLGHYGRGPWVFMSELDTNLLSANQSSATDALATTEGFTASHGSIATSTAQFYQGSRALLWTLPSSTPGTPPYVSLTWSGSTYGIPVLPLTDYAASARISADSATFDARIALVWKTVAGAVISTSQWSPTSLSGSLSDFLHVAISGLSPATAAYVEIRLIAETMVNDGHMVIDQLQFEMSSVSTDWAPGAGVPRVAIIGADREYDWHGFNHLGQVELQEVGV